MHTHTHTPTYTFIRKYITDNNELIMRARFIKEIRSDQRLSGLTSEGEKFIFEQHPTH